MTVWIITKIDSVDHEVEILGVYATKELAEQYISSIPKVRNFYHYAIEYNVNGLEYKE
jgi:hypothetical protein